jgi:hypothetical protein
MHVLYLYQAVAPNIRNFKHPDQDIWIFGFPSRRLCMDLMKWGAGIRQSLARESSMELMTSVAGSSSFRLSRTTHEHAYWKKPDNP